MWAPDREGLAPRQLGGGSLEATEAGEQRLQATTGLHPGQLRANAVVGAMAEGDAGLFTEGEPGCMLPLTIAPSVMDLSGPLLMETSGGAVRKETARNH